MRRLILILLVALFVASCSKKIPLAEPFDPARDFKEANMKLEDKYEEEARQIFQNIKRLDTTGEYAALAQLRIADSYVVEDMPDLAVDEYQEFLDTYPRHKYASYAQYQIGMVYYRLIKGPDRGFGSAQKALDAFERLNGLFPRNPYLADVEIKIMQCRAIIAEHEYRVGVFYYKQDACRGAVNRFEGVRKDYPKYTGMSSLLYRLAICYKKLGNEAETTRALDELKTKFPASGLHKKALEEIQELVTEASQ